MVHVNDTHSYAAGTSSKGLPCYDPQACYGGFGRIAAFIQNQKALHKNVLALDAGDFWQGTLYFSSGRETFALELERAMPYDAITLGNHEFDLGCKAAADYIARLGKPVVAANILRNKDCPLSKAPFVPYIIRSFDGVRVAVIGLANDEVLEISKACPHTQFIERKEALQKAIRSLETGRYGLGGVNARINGKTVDLTQLTKKELLSLLHDPTSERQFIMYEALRKGATVDELASALRRAGAAAVYALTVTSVEDKFPFGKKDG